MNKDEIVNLSPETVATLVKDRKAARVVIGELLQKYSTEFARDEIKWKASNAKKSFKNAALAKAGNLLNNGNSW